jgi:hypothetical protein
VAFNIFPLIAAQYAPNSQTTMYTAGAYTRIDAVSVCNTDTVAHTISINLVSSGGSVSNANLTTQAQTVLPGQTWNSANEIGKVLNVGDFISVLASVASKLTICAGGLIQV